MIEYIYNAIVAKRGEDTNIVAEIMYNDGTPITENCSLTISNDESPIYQIAGFYNEAAKEWVFNIPASFSTGLKGRYYYKIFVEDESIITEAIYFNK